MLEVVIVAAALGVLAGFAGFAATFLRGLATSARSIARGSGWLERRRADRVIVHTTDGQTFEGNLLEVARDGLVLTAVVMVDHGVNVAGDVWVPRPKVLMVQRRPLEG